MADVITLSDDDFCAPAAQLQTQKHASKSGRNKDKAAKQWDDIFSNKPNRKCRNGDSKSKRPSERSSGRSSARGASPERPRRRSSSNKSVIELDDSSEEVSGSEKDSKGSEPELNGRRSRSKRSLAAALGVSKADCRRDDGDGLSRHEHHTTGDKRTKQSGRPLRDDNSSRPKRLASEAEVAAPAVKRVRLTRVEPAAHSKDSSAAAVAAAEEAEPGPDPCQQGLEEVCALLTPLLSGDEVKLVAKVRRRHAAVLALAGAKSGRRQHLLGATQQCGERLRAEPGRCFTVLRGFLERLDQIKLVASSAQSRTAPPSAAGATEVKAKAGTVEKAKRSAVEKLKPSPSSSPRVNSSAPASSSAAAPAEQEEKEARRHRRHLAKLEKTLRRLEREIVRQEQQEVDWEDAAGSAYIISARLKRRYVQVYRYYCQLVGAEEEAQRLGARRIRFNGTRYPEINRRIEKFVNRTREFPDFKDVLSLIKTANHCGKLRLGPGAMHDQAKEAFLQLGALLQKRRRAALAESMDVLAGAEEWRSRDPAADDTALGGRLAENAASGRERLNQVFSEFVQRQETAASERRKKRVGATDGSDEDEEEEDEEDETEDAEESEVTDEELEREAPKPAGGGAIDSDVSDEGTDMDAGGEDQGSVETGVKSETKMEVGEEDEGDVKERAENAGKVETRAEDEGKLGAKITRERVEANMGNGLSVANDGKKKAAIEDRQMADKCAEKDGNVPGKNNGAEMSDGEDEINRLDSEKGNENPSVTEKESADRTGAGLSDAERDSRDAQPVKDGNDSPNSQKIATEKTGHLTEMDAGFKDKAKDGKVAVPR